MDRRDFLIIAGAVASSAMALGGPVTYIDPEEARKRDAPNVYDRAWELWKRKAIVN